MMADGNGAKQRIIIRKIAIFMVALAIVASAGPVHAQQAGKVHRIGYLTVRSPESEKSYFPAFQQGLRELGYFEGRNIVIEARYANGNNDRLPALAAELLRRKVEIVVIGGGAAALAVQRLSKTIPIVMAEATAPVARGIVTNIARPGGNTTGLSARSVEIFGKYLELLKEIVPGVTRVAVLWNPRGPASTLGWRSLQRPARKLGIQLHSMEVRSTGDLEQAFHEALAARVEGLYVTPGPRVPQKEIGRLILKSRLPAVGSSGRLVRRGTIIAYRTNFADLYRRAATYVDKILKGAKPGDLPIELPVRFDFTVNLKTAKALGITLPRSILFRATEVIE